MANKTIPTRSWLFTPGTHAERFGKAGEVGADILIIDLEDAVSPSDKPRARNTAIDYLSAPKDRPHRALRINGLDTPAGVADLDALLGSHAAPDYVVLPKTESAGHLLILDRLLAASGKDARLVGLIESARGLAGLEAIAAATPRLFGLMLGAADMAADLGAATAWDPLVHVRGRLVAACALAGVAPIDSPYFDIHDAEGLEAARWTPPRPSASPPRPRSTRARSARSTPRSPPPTRRSTTRGRSWPPTRAAWAWWTAR